MKKRKFLYNFALFVGMGILCLTSCGKKEKTVEAQSEAAEGILKGLDAFFDEID